MGAQIDPAADAVWDAVVTEASADGIVTTAPETNEDWLELRKHAVTLVESTNLLLMEGRRVAATGSRSEMPGVDLEPEEIQTLLDEDRAAWDRLVDNLHTSGVEVLRASRDALFKLWDGLDPVLGKRPA